MESVLIERLHEVTPSLERDAAGRSEEPGLRFAEIVSDLVADVNRKQNDAADKAEGLAKGEVGIMDAVLALNDADMSLRMIMQIRDKAIDSYQRILRSI